ncbi:hypothetical protein GGR52DRAFT_590366 [Hypoxylon sp. FL1284]|nr:hypothetical protein GGR52DRAFT_590366 [Hypoxylon sp. FL1284]
MSGRGRGGRGRGGRGGFGATRKTGPQGMPGADDPALQFNEKPQDTYPKFYLPPVAPQLDEPETRAVTAFVSFRRAFHGTPLYTHRHMTDDAGVGDVASSSSSSLKPTDPARRTYGQAQLNARFGVRSRATVDPFRAVPLYSHRFVDEARALPDLRAARPGAGYVRDFFPEELWATLDGRDVGGPRGGLPGAHKRRGVKRKAAAAAIDDEDEDEDPPHDGRARGRRGLAAETEEERKARIEAAVKNGENDENGDGGGGGGGGDAANNNANVNAAKDDVDLDEDEAEMLSQEDDEYDDDDGGDYDAEQYFDGGDNDEYPDDDGAGEGAMDF